jgi:lipopolysaccharide transport system ATP-binding protein
MANPKWIFKGRCMPARAIRVENLSKMYRIGSRRASYKTLRETIMQTLLSPAQRIQRVLTGRASSASGLTEEFWALSNISFEVQEGEVLGIIGRNGAGKSTLLKLLSRITEPTHGHAEIHGRVGSLLEVGTGFHPELTGRENIYLNGAILGMRHAEIDQKFDEIVAFAEVEQFIDTPVKHYSSGMRLRLGFAVAAHLEPDILIVDEVLAVGDAAFQKKCLGKMGDVAGSGRTVLFVSHNLDAVLSLCNRAILIERGQLTENGNPSEIVSIYQNKFTGLGRDASDLARHDHYGTGKARFTRLSMTFLDLEGNPTEILPTGGDLIVDLSIACYQKIEETNIAAIIYDTAGYRLADVNSALKGDFLKLEAGQHASVQFHLPRLLLNSGHYTLGLWMGRPNIEDTDGVLYAASIDVVPNNKDVQYSVRFPGPYRCEYTHQILIEELPVS